MMSLLGEADLDFKDASPLQKYHIDVGQVPHLNLTLRMLAHVSSVYLNIYSASP